MSAQRAEEHERQSVCRICPAQCGILVTVDRDRVLSVRGDPDHPVSRGYTCSKGRALPDFHHHPDRLDEPRLHGRTAGWDASLDDLAARAERLLRDHGQQSVGIYSSMGVGFDSASGLVEARLRSGLGLQQKYSALMLDIGPVMRANELVAGSAWEMHPQWLPEEDSPRVVIMVGVNPVVSHGYQSNLPNPVQRIRDFRARGGEVWVIDPRKTETAELADGHVAPRPGTDVVVLAWLIREVLAQGADEEELSRYCDPNDIARLRVAVEPFDLGSVTERCGVDAPSLVALRDAVRRSGQVAVLSGTGVNFARHGLLTEWLRWVLLIVTGSVDRPGGMWISPGWVTPLENREHWVHGAADASDRPGPASRPDLRMLSGEYPAVAMVDEIEAGNIRGLLVFGGSPLTAAPDPARLRVALQSLDFLAVADVVENELTSLATHVLPVAAMLERSDAPRNKIHTGFADAVVPLGANRKPAWWVWAQLAQRLGVDILDGVHPDECTDEILLRQMLAHSRGGADALFATGARGVDPPRLWGWVHDRALPNGKWRIAPAVLLDRLPEVWSSPDDGELVFVARRARRAVNALRYTRREDGDKEPPELLIHPDDALARTLVAGQRVDVTSHAGTVHAVVRPEPRVPSGTVSLTHGWADPNAAVLIDNEVDPLTGQPFFTAFPVELAKGKRQ